MHRIDHATRLVNANGPGKDGFTGGTPDRLIPATAVTPEWLNAVQEELSNIVIDSGAGLIKGTNNQASQAIIATINAQRVIAQTANINTAAYNPAGWATAHCARFTNLISSNIKGMVSAGLIVKRRVLYSANSALRLYHDDPSAADADRILTPDARTFVVGSGGVEVFHDNGHWHVMARDPFFGSSVAVPPDCDYTYHDGLGNPIYVVRDLILPASSGRAAFGNWVTGSRGNVITGDASAAWYVPIRLPFGAMLTRVAFARDNVGGAGAWTYALDRVNVDPTNPANDVVQLLDNNSRPDAGGAGLGLVTSAQVDAIADPAGFYMLRIIAPAVMSGGQTADLRWVNITFQDPGPRNY